MNEIKLRVVKNQEAQQYDPDTPRCMTCVYCKREQLHKYSERDTLTRRGKVRVVKVRIRSHPVRNPIVDKCTFGNFLVKPNGLCNEWHGKDGDKLEAL